MTETTDKFKAMWLDYVNKELWKQRIEIELKYGPNPNQTAPLKLYMVSVTGTMSTIEFNNYRIT